MPRIEAEAANIHSPTFQQPELHAAQDLEQQSDSSKKDSGAKLSAESSSALSNLSEFRALQENNIFKKIILRTIQLQSTEIPLSNFRTVTRRAGIEISRT